MKDFIEDTLVVLNAAMAWLGARLSGNPVKAGQRWNEQLDRLEANHWRRQREAAGKAK